MRPGGHDTFSVLTIAREYGSGGGQIARRIAERLSWSLLDKALVERELPDHRIGAMLNRQKILRAFYGIVDNSAATLLPAPKS